MMVVTLITTTAQAAGRPNVVIIYGDDVGYGDVGAYGAKKIPTPNIDKFAKEGLLFTDGHCSAATCTPFTLFVIDRYLRISSRRTGIATPTHR